MAINNSGWHRLASKLEADLKEDLMEFLEENPNPADTAVHEWAEERGYEVDDIEEVVYEIATDHVQMGEDSEDEDDSEDDDDEDSEEEEWEDEVEGGLADDKEPGDYDLDQLLKGIEVEFEHTDKPELALEIAMDHLEEQDDYYDELAKMEDKIKKESHKVAQGESYEDAVKGIAIEVFNETRRSNLDASELVSLAIDGSDYTKFVEASMEVLLNSENSNAIFDSGNDLDTSKGWQGVLNQMAYQAMEADVWEALKGLGIV